MRTETEQKAEAFDNYIEAAKGENANQEMKIAANCLTLSLAGLKVREYDQHQMATSCSGRAIEPEQ